MKIVANPRHVRSHRARWRAEAQQAKDRGGGFVVLDITCRVAYAARRA